MIVGFHAPPPGSLTGVADYAETLLIILRRIASDSGDVVEAGRRQADIHLYHLGNNLLHRDIYAQALATPGIAVLHDAVLNHFLIGALSRAQYIDEWVYNYGEWRRHIGEELWESRARSGTDPRYFRFPMLRRIAESSRALIVHNPGAAEWARASGAKRVHVIPHFFEERGSVDAADCARFRERIDVPQGSILFGIFGYLREPKRVLPSLAAFKRLHAVRPRTALLIAGKPVSLDFERLLNMEAKHPAVRRLGYLSATEFEIAARSADCCINLRYPGAGETSGIAVRLMGMGKPVLVSDVAENLALPPAAVLRVSPGIAETAELLDYMVLISDFPCLAREIGRAARVHIQKHHALETVARQYWEVLCASK